MDVKSIRHGFVFYPNVRSELPDRNTLPLLPSNSTSNGEELKTFPAVTTVGDFAIVRRADRTVFFRTDYRLTGCRPSRPDSRQNRDRVGFHRGAWARGCAVA